MTRRATGGPRDDAGFTLVELLVTMVIATIVLFAVLKGADVFARSAKSATDATVVQDSARTTVREMVTFLRQGRVAAGQTSPIPAQWTPSRSDLTVAAYVRGAQLARPGEEQGWVRYCAATTGTTTALIVGVRLGDAYLAPGPCSAADTTNGWFHAVAVERGVQLPGRLFNFAAACPTCPVSTVGIRLAIGSAPGSASFNSVITDAVSFRNRSTP